MSFPTGFIARGGFFQPHEASRLQSFREPQSIPRAWAHAAPRYRQSDNFTNQIATLRRQVNGAQQPRLNYSGMHPFKIYNFPRNMRYFLNNDDWRRVKVRNGYVLYYGNADPLSEDETGPVRVFGTDFISRITDDVFLGDGQTPPTSNITIDPFGFWNEFAVPNDGQIYLIWITLCYSTPSIAYGVTPSPSTMDFTATSLLDGSTFTEHWLNPPAQDPFHVPVGYVWIDENGKLQIQQYLTDNVILPYPSRGVTADNYKGPTVYCGLYDNSSWYYPGNIVKVEDSDFINLYIFAPSDADGYGWNITKGPIQGVDPGSGLVANAPWITFSRSPKGKWQVVGGINTFVHT